MNNYRNKIFISKITSPRRRLKTQSGAILKTFQHMGMIYSKDVSVRVETKGIDDSVTVSLAGGTAHEKEVLAAAMREITSPIKKQKYLLIHKSKSKFKRYLLATPCPELIARKREYVDYLQKSLNQK